MASITIRNLDESIKGRLRVRAAHHKRSMEDEARKILAAALTGEYEAEQSLAESIQKRFRALGGVELELPQRQAMRTPPHPGK
jgi:antitoxin FitA